MGKQRKERRKLQKEKKHTKATYSESEIKRSNPFINFFDKKYKLLIVIPFILLILAIAQIAYQDATTGEFMHRDVSLQGGLTITIPIGDEELDRLEIENQLQEELPETDFDSRALTSSAGKTEAFIFESTVVEDDKREELIDKLVELTGVERNEMSLDITGPALGESFYRQAIIAVFIALVLMAVVVFAYFRSFVPSFAIMLSTVSDVIITLAIINLLEIKMSTAGLAAFLMLIGYSIDSDILLASRVLRTKENTIFSRVLSATKTGLTMTGSTLVALAVAIMLSQLQVLTQIMLILFIGLTVDALTTWIMNVGILRYYLERKG
ncbi:MAG: protein translocase subunit SecF [Nanoarchaeota archaeon]